LEAAEKDDVQTLQELTSSGVDVTGIVIDGVSMCVAKFGELIYHIAGYF